MRGCSHRIAARAKTALQTLQILGCQELRHKTLVQSVQVVSHLLQAVVLIQWDCSAKEERYLTLLSIIHHFMTANSPRRQGKLTKMNVLGLER